MKLLEGHQIGINFDGRWLYQDVNFTLTAHHILALIGENGVGKTTLLRAILGEQAVSAGELTWHSSQAVVAYVPQYRADMQAFPLTIKEYVSLSMDHGIRPWFTSAEKEWLTHIIADTKLTAIANRRIDQASGGERQRAFLAQALVRRPQILILDEATANLDQHAKFELMDVVDHYRQHHELSVIMVSHDTDIVQRYADDYLFLTAGTSEFGTSPDAAISRMKQGQEATQHV
ncbi:ATP-binding cassette domain-containing protein [Weissella diestrammenae]|uniref:ATP-binding cassette domain-containing protein n=1 Tax=Weissella diestrammenae TaxID=1162633 RepID=A0A7G9T733_9LACO|nr:ATP-binding cassette domain-containing protein [Weissella diestrammenae]MCM0582494.1 ATP-binding cassette domain-containing protein [Weissella diestrammenae]QNN75908.1 ATP-binding cassette domain-containing protein [Weissella diestrammenae]